MKLFISGFLSPGIAPESWFVLQDTNVFEDFRPGIL